MTVRSNTSLAVEPALSVATTLMLVAPAVLGAVPLKVRVLALKLSQLGNAEPSFWVAV